MTEVCVFYHLDRLNMGTPEANLADMRKPYNGIDEQFGVKDLISKEPFGNFKHWLEQACNCSSIFEPNAMAVATATPDGKPSVRMVLLKGYDSSGFKFFTNYGSRKGRELSENPHASLMFYWEPLKKMIRIDGTVEKLSEDEAVTYFHLRPRASQFSACVSNQSNVVASLEVLETECQELMKQYSDETQLIPKPESWGGYCVRPTTVEFWQGQTDRLHDRIVFRRPHPDEVLDPAVTAQGDDGWVYERLCP